MLLGQVDHSIYPPKHEEFNMTCYHPKIRIEDLTKWETAADGHKYHPARIVEAQKYDKLTENEMNIVKWHYKETIIPCRNCIGCRLDYARTWANRGYLELKTQGNDNNWFITLTYDEEHLPKSKEESNGTLVKKDLETFIKNLRQEQRRAGKTDIKYMACGEYGEKNERPHYHLIMFNLKLDPEDLFEARILNKEFYYRSKTIERHWTKGISNLSQATWNNISYVARYITKKLNGPESEKYYENKGQIKEFFRVSKGIGKMYYLQNRDKIYTKDEIYIKNRKGVTVTKPPKYYDDLFKKENEKELKKIKDKRKRLQESQIRITKEHTKIGSIDQLAIEERTKAYQLKGLPSRHCE